MPLYYEPSPTVGAFKQGELLSGVREPWGPYDPNETPNSDIALQWVSHPLAVILTADCDLEQDFNARFATDPDKTTLMQTPGTADNHAGLVRYTLLCDLFPLASIRDVLTWVGSADKRRIDSNQSERFHTLHEAAVPDTSGVKYPDYFIDFRRTIAVPTQRLYADRRMGLIARAACIPPPYLQDLMHRCYGYLSRVGLD